MEREILYADFGSWTGFLIPKKRGEGFLKAPLGHHPSRLGFALAEYEDGGLDGYIACTFGKNHRPEALLTALKIFKEHTGLSAREIGVSEFWEKTPAPSDNGTTEK